MNNNYKNINEKVIGKKKPIILFSFETWDLTLREIIFSIFIVGIMVTVGFFISSSIKHKINQNQLIYRQAAQIDNSVDQFKWALDTDIGHIFAEGDMETIDPVKHEKLKGEWLSIEAVYQKYTMHTRVITYTTTVNGKSRTRTRTETYWSWDTYKRESIKAKKIKFLDVEFPVNKFNINNYGKSETVKIGHNRRIKFNMVNPKMHGTIFGKILNKTIDGKADFWSGCNLKSIYDNYVSDNTVTIFWIFWIPFTIAVLFFFFYAENKWLDD